MIRNLEEQDPKANNRQYNTMGSLEKSIREGKIEDMESFMRTLARAAEERLTLKPPRIRKRDCHPELERLVACRKIALEQDDEEEVKRITRLSKRRSRKIRTEKQITKFKDWERDPIKYFKKGYVAKSSNLKNERGELVNDRARPDTFADYFEKVQGARNNDIDQQRQEAPYLEPTYDTEAEVKQVPLTKKELNEAIGRLRNNKTRT